MKAETTLVEIIATKIETFTALSIELEKLKLIRKFSNVAALITYKAIVSLVFFLFFLFANISLALWLGFLLGKNYYGFLLIATFYFVALIGASKFCKKSFEQYIVCSISNLLKQ